MEVTRSMMREREGDVMVCFVSIILEVKDRGRGFGGFGDVLD